KFAYAILQSPIGDTDKKRFAKSRVIRAVKLDVSDPLNARVIGEYLVLSGPAGSFSAKQKQEKVSWSDADWIGPDRLLVIERGKALVKLITVDFSKATDVLDRKDEFSLTYEDAAADLTSLGVQPAQTREI